MNDRLYHVLLLGDCDAISATLDTGANSLQCVTEKVSNGVQALEFLHRTGVVCDVVIICHPLQDENVCLIAQQIKAEHPELEVICVVKEVRDASTCLSSLHIDRILSCPLNWPELACTIRAAADASRDRKILKALEAIMLTINSTDNLSAILLQTCQAAVELFNADHSGFVTFEEHAEYGVTVAEYPNLGDLSTLHTLIPVKGIPAEEEIVIHQRPYETYAVASDPNLGEVAERLIEKGIHSIFIMPVVVSGRVVASFSLDLIQQHRQFSPDEKRMCQNLANFVGMAIANVDYHQESESIRKSYQAARLVAQKSTEGKLEETLSLIVHSVVEFMGADISTVYTYDEERGRFLSCRGEGHRLQPSTMVSPDQLVGSCTPRRILELPEPYYALSEDPASDVLFRSSFVEGEAIKACFAMQLRYEDSPVGVLFIDFKKPRRFKDHEVEAYRHFGNQAAVSIHNAMLRENIRQRLSALERLYSPKKISVSNEEQEAHLQRIAQEALEIISLRHPGAFSHIMRLDGDHFDCLAAYPPSHQEGLCALISSIDLNRPDIRVGIIGQAIRESDTVLDGDVETNTNYLEHSPEIHSQLSTPLYSSGRIFGVLSIEHPLYHAFNQEDKLSLEHLALYATAAIQSARHFKMNRTLIQMSERVTQGEGLYTALKSGVDELKDFLGCEVINIYVYYEDDQEISYPAITAGYLLNPMLINDREAKTPAHRIRLNEVRPGSVLPLLLSKAEPYYAALASHDPIFTKGDFVVREKIVTAASIPLKVQGKVVGMLFLNYRQHHEFSEQEMQEINVFANYLAITIHNARQYAALRAASGWIGSRSAVAWMHLTSKGWLKQVGEHATRIKSTVDVVRRLVEAENLPQGMNDRLAAYLKQIRKEATAITNQSGTTPPLSAVDQQDDVELSSFVEQRLDELWENNSNYHFLPIHRYFDPLGEKLYVRCNQSWLRYALDSLVEYIVEKMNVELLHKLYIGFSVQEGRVELFFQPRVHPSPQKKKKEEPERPVRLLVVDAILETYGGNLKEEENEQAELCYTMSLPLVV